jgi:hypothetical protein
MVGQTTMFFDSPQGEYNLILHSPWGESKSLISERGKLITSTLHLIVAEWCQYAIGYSHQLLFANSF